MQKIEKRANKLEDKINKCQKRNVSSESCQTTCEPCIYTISESDNEQQTYKQTPNKNTHCSTTSDTNAVSNKDTYLYRSPTSGRIQRRQITDDERKELRSSNIPTIFSSDKELIHIFTQHGSDNINKTMQTHWRATIPCSVRKATRKQRIN